MMSTASTGALFRAAELSVLSKMSLMFLGRALLFDYSVLVSVIAVASLIPLMAAEGSNRNQPPSRLPRLIISHPNRRNPPLIINPQAVQPNPNLSLSLSLGSPREGQGPQIDNNNPVDKPSSSSSSVESEVVSTDEDDVEGVNGCPPMEHENERAPNRLRMQARRLMAIRRTQRRRAGAAIAAGARVQAGAGAHVTRSPTPAPTAPERAMASAMQHPALLRALRRMHEEGLVSPRNPMFGRRHMHPVRTPPNMPRVRIGSRVAEIMSTRARAAEPTRTDQLNKNAPSNDVLQRNSRPIFEIAEGSARRARVDEVNEFGVDVVQRMPNVIAVGNGPLGRRIEGFLYRFSEEEEAKIVCVCHGRFFNPAGFYKHAGGTDVSNPLKYIMVVGVPPRLINSPGAHPNPNLNHNGNENAYENNNEDSNGVSNGDGDGDGN
ncbi:Tify domain binding domain [Dillenia turbinata]|uniref:Ninja-family protein n=1 Tax=Dillenia turbinata TaxID=194707 RepID=A0AAN8UXG9_9MAGN